MGMLESASKRSAKSSKYQREDTAVVTAFSDASAAYTLSYRGTTIGPVWSRGSIKYAVGSTVTVLVVGNLVKAVIP